MQIDIIVYQLGVCNLSFVSKKKNFSQETILSFLKKSHLTKNGKRIILTVMFGIQDAKPMKDKGQFIIGLNQKEVEQIEVEVEKEEEYDSDVYDNMDDDDPIGFRNFKCRCKKILKKDIIVLVFDLQKYQNIFSELLHNLVIPIMLRLLYVNSFQICFHRNLVGKS